MPTSAKIAVIGSNSFSGASFVGLALDRDAHVLGISRSDEPDPVFLPYRWLSHGSGTDANFQFHRLDLNTHLDKILDVIKSERPDYIVNFAAQSMVGESWEHPEDWYQTNVLSTVKFHNRLRKECGFLKRYVHITTPEVYGNTSGWIPENTPYKPSTPYAVSRASGDMNLQTLIDTFDFPAVMSRAANVYGPGQQLYRIIPRAILYSRLGKTLQLHGGGHSKRSFIHINDVCDATWRIMMDGAQGEIYHISTENIITIRDMIKLICTKTETVFDNFVEISEERLGKDDAYMLSSSKIRNALGWSDRIDLDQGLDDCIAWVDSNLETLKLQRMSYIHKQ